MSPFQIRFLDKKHFLSLYSWRFPSTARSCIHYCLVHGHMTSNNETPWAGNIAKTMTSNVRNGYLIRACGWRWPDVVAGILRFSKFALVVFCYMTNHLMTGPLGSSEFCVTRISMLLSTLSRETLRFSGNKIHGSPRASHKVVIVTLSQFT